MKRTDKACQCFPVASRDAETGLCCACGLHIDTVHTLRYGGGGRISSPPITASRNVPLAAVHNPYVAVGSKCTGGVEDGLLQNCIPEGTPEIDRDAAMTWVYPSNVPVREYQRSIVSRALFSNTLVCLPTGMGKTLIAAVVMANFYQWYPNGQVIFMSPTKPLVNQQIRACHDVMGLLPERTAELQGSVKAEERKALWKERHIFYCTPQSLVNDIASGACRPKKTVCVVVDESHRATGNYAYVKAIKAIADENPMFRVLALSATPGSNAESIQKVITNLRISAIEYWGEDDPEIAKHLHLKQQEVIKCPIGKGLADLRTRLFAVMKPILQKLISSGVIHAMPPENVHPYVCIMARDKLTKDPGNTNIRSGDFGRLLDDITLLTKLANVKDNLGTHGAADLCSKLDGWEEEIHLGSCKSRSLEAMLRTMEYQYLLKCAKRLAGDMSEGGKGSSISHPKLAKLRDVLTEHFQRYAAGKQSTRAIVFSQFRSSVDEIISFLDGEELLSVCRFVGQGSSSVAQVTASSKLPPEQQRCRQLNNKQEAKNTVGKPLEASASFTRGQSQKEQKAVLTAFRNGVYNCLVATCIAEEGLDIGEVDLIVSYDCLSSPVRMVQRMGRTGRKRPGRVVMLVTEGIEESKLQSSASKSKRIVSLLKQQGKFTLHPELNSRMIPPEIDPQMVEKDIDISEYRASQVGGVCSSSKAGGYQKDLMKIARRGGGTNSNSTNWRLTMSQLKKLKECYSGETTYKANPLLGWMESRSRFRTVRFPHSLQTLTLLDVHCFVENQEWETVYDEARMAAMLDLWHVNNNMNGRNGAVAPPLTRIRRGDNDDCGNELKNEEVYRPSHWVSKQQPTKAQPFQNYTSRLNDDQRIPTSGMINNMNDKNVIIKMIGREEVALETTDGDDIYSKGDTTVAIRPWKSPPHQTPPNCSSIPTGTLLGLEKGKGNGDGGGIVTTKSKYTGEVPSLQLEEEKSFDNNQEQQQQNGKLDESIWRRIEGSKETASVSGCEEISNVKDGHHKNEKIITSHDLLQQQTSSSSLPFPLFDVSYKNDVKDDAGCVPREMRRTDLPAVGLLNLPIPPMGRQRSDGGDSYQQHDDLMDFRHISSSSTCEGGRNEGNKQYHADPVVVIEQREEEEFQAAVQALNDNVNNEEKGEYKEFQEVDDLPPPPLQREEREEGGDVLFPSQTTAIDDTCDIRCMEEEVDDEVDREASLKMVNFPDLQDCNSTCSSAVCGICGGGGSLDDDPIVLCDGTGCDVAAHAGCFGMKEIPTGEWLCDTCKFSLSHDDRDRPSSSTCDVAVCCSLCGRNGGVMKQTKGRVWVHLVCAVLTREIGIEDSEPSVIPRSPSFVDPERVFLRCVECAGLGGGVQCSMNNCFVAVHPFCALKAGYNLFFPSLDDIDEEKQRFLLHCRDHSKCSPLFSSSPLERSSRDAMKKKLIQLMAMDAVNEVQREAEAEAAGTGRNKYEFQWHTSSLETVTPLIEQRMGIKLRDQHSQGIIHRALCELKLSKSGCQSKDFPTSVDTMTPPLPRKTKKRVRVIGDDIHLFTANAAIKLSPLLGPEKSCVDVVGKAAEDSHHILTPVRNIVHNISSKTSKECIDIGISASSPDGVRKNNVLGENRSKILKRRRQQQQQYGADECRQESKEAKVRRRLKTKRMLQPEEKRMMEYLIDEEADVTSGDSSEEDENDRNSNIGTQQVTASQDSFINDGSIGHSQTQSPGFESEHDGAEVDHHCKTSYKTSGFSPAFYRQVDAGNGTTPSPTLGMKRSRFIGAVLQYAREGGDAMQIEQACMSPETQSSPTPSRGGGSDVPTHHITSSSCSINSPPVPHTTSSVVVPVPVPYNKGKFDYASSNSSVISAFNGTNKRRVEFTDEQVERMKKKKLEALQRRQQVEEGRRKQHEQQSKYRHKKEENHHQHKNNNQQRNDDNVDHEGGRSISPTATTTTSCVSHNTSIGVSARCDENGHDVAFEEAVAGVCAETEVQVSRGAASFAPSASSSICEEKAVAISVMAETGVNAFYKRQESTNCGRAVISDSSELAAPLSRKLLPRVEDQEYQPTHSPLASAAAAASAFKADVCTAVTNHTLIVLKSFNLSPVAASVAAQFGGYIKKMSLVLSSSMEKEAHVIEHSLDKQLSSLLALYTTVIVLIVENNVVKMANKNPPSQIEWPKCLREKGIVEIRCSNALNAAKEIERIRIEEEQQMRGLPPQIVTGKDETTNPDERYLSIVMNDCQKLPALPLSSVGALYLLHTLRQRPLTEALNLSARDVRTSVPGMGAQQAGIVTKHLRRALKTRR